VRPGLCGTAEVCSLRGQGVCSVADIEPIFQPWPPEIHFRGYAPFETCTAQLFLRNNDKVRRALTLPAICVGTRRVRPIMRSAAAVLISSHLRTMQGGCTCCHSAAAQSPACAAPLSRPRARQAPRRVRVLAPQHLPVTVQPLPAGRLPDGAPGSAAAGAGAGLKVAPGMEAAYAVTYCPAGREDFACSLLVETERESFAVPIIGTGAARAQLMACTAGSTTCAQTLLPFTQAAGRPVIESNACMVMGG